ncbi:hydroxyacid dehydrogenase [Candidatus Woesearchaeota archaeon]|nr:hydroxyacid dehydrogenase [Candidatus Woesearchaeota archaeon]
MKKKYSPSGKKTGVKVGFFEVQEWEEATLKSDLAGCDVTFFSEELKLDNVHDAFDREVISVFIYSNLTKKVLDMLPNLKLIATRSTGYDHIDLAECDRRGIIVCNVPFYGENTVAEHTFALILALSRRIPESYDRTVKADFSIDGLQGFDLRKKTLGVIGTGHIGLHVIRMAKGFEMNVIAYDKFANEKLAHRNGFKYVEFDYLLANSDIITLHLPDNKFTHHTINRNNVFKIKKGAYLINTARGGLVETEALVQALVKNQLGGAGLDVLEEESAIKEENQLLSAKFSNDELKIILRNHILLKLKNVIITPHNAFNSQEALQRILDTSLDNVRAYIQNKVKNQVFLAK